uniref:Uncharacterized protein n=1 Tax=Nelumbo nucifera TaxID=4432 RepID=A0A822Y854_NELNU|nr:TPA_asm: hypothetical protein HUJ06_027236 [Nelumbo nucifera]
MVFLNKFCPSVKRKRKRRLPEKTFGGKIAKYHQENRKACIKEGKRSFERNVGRIQARVIKAIKHQSEQTFGPRISSLCTLPCFLHSSKKKIQSIGLLYTDFNHNSNTPINRNNIDCLMYIIIKRNDDKDENPE